MPGMRFETTFLCLREEAEAGGLEEMETLFFKLFVAREAFGLGVLATSTLNS